MNGEPYGRMERRSSAPQDDTSVTFRYGYDVEGDSAGPQYLGTRTDHLSAIRAARIAARERADQISELRLSVAVRPWTQRVHVATTVTFDDAQFVSLLP